MAKPIRVRHRVTETEATQWDGTQETADALGMKAVGLGASGVAGKSARLLVPTAHGETYADVGDWVIHSDAQGRPFVRTAKAFEAEYEKID